MVRLLPCGHCRAVVTETLGFLGLHCHGTAGSVSQLGLTADTQGQSGDSPNAGGEGKLLLGPAAVGITAGGCGCGPCREGCRQARQSVGSDERLQSCAAAWGPSLCRRRFAVVLQWPVSARDRN